MTKITNEQAAAIFDEYLPHGLTVEQYIRAQFAVNYILLGRTLTEDNIKALQDYLGAHKVNGAPDSK